jgi:hypothetical protein
MREDAWPWPEDVPKPPMPGPDPGPLDLLSRPARELLTSIRDGPLACVRAVPSSAGRVRRMAQVELYLWMLIDYWDRPDGRWITLSAWGAAELGVHLVETSEEEARETARSRRVRVGWRQPLVRWADLDDEGSPPIQPRESGFESRPCPLDALAWPVRRPEDDGSPDPRLLEYRFATRDHRGRRPVPAQGEPGGGYGQARGRAG